jgi:hypothetical protein
MVPEIMPAGEVFRAHPGLAHDIAVARLRDFPTFTDDQYRHIAHVVAHKYPGMELHTLRLSGPSFTLAEFTWDAEKLILGRILHHRDVPQLPRRTSSSWCIFGTSALLTVHRVRGRKLRVRIDVPDFLPDSHPLAILRPTAIASMAPAPAPYWLRLAVDNSRTEGLQQTARRGQLRLIVNDVEATTG